MSDAAFRQTFDAAFFGAWGAAVGDLSASYTPPAGGAAVSVDVLEDTDVVQFDEGGAAGVAAWDKVFTFRREQIEPQAGATLVHGGLTYRLVQRVAGDSSLSRWGVERV